MPPVSKREPSIPGWSENQLDDGPGGPGVDALAPNVASHSQRSSSPGQCAALLSRCGHMVLVLGLFSLSAQTST